MTLPGSNRPMALAVLGTTLVLVMATVAIANDFGDPWNESNFQRYWYEDASLNSVWQSDLDIVREQTINPTHMYTETRNLHDNSDVAAYLRDLGAGGPVGVENCIDQSGSICHHWHVRFNSAYTYNPTSRKHIGCHEFGHTLGLKHYADSHVTNSCMKEASSWDFSVHDVNHINGYYANNPNG
jgi:hypothetical protein